MKVNKTEIPGLVVIEPQVFDDGRGFFLESYHSERYAGEGLPAGFCQDNVSRSRRGVSGIT